MKGLLPIQLFYEWDSLFSERAKSLSEVFQDFPLKSRHISMLQQITLNLTLKGRYVINK